MNELTQQYLTEILDYDANTGVYTRLTSYRQYKIGDRVGCINSDGYRQIKIKGKIYLEHRLAWLYVYGYLPTQQIDHRNGIKDDNRIGNLREATHSENQQNRGTHKNNSSGYTGVSFHKASGKWKAYIQKDGKLVHLGYHATPELAYATHLKAKAELHTFNPVPR